jgi:hypothetical protein
MAALEARITGLSERQRELLPMFYGENQRAEKIARLWGRTVHAVYKTLKVMRKALFDCVTHRLRDLAEPLDHPLDHPSIGSGKLLVASQFTDFATSGLELKAPEQTDCQIVVEPPAAHG